MTVLNYCFYIYCSWQSGDIEIVNNTTKDTCRLKFSPYSYFSRDVPRKVSLFYIFILYFFIDYQAASSYLFFIVCFDAMNE